jgi:hypothetical protein
MERQLLSSNLLFNKVTICLMSFVFLLSIEFSRKDSTPDWIMLSFPFLVLAGIWFFMFRGKVHPVYYDDNYLYWSKNSKEQIVPYGSIESLNVTLGGGRAISRVNLKYRDVNNNIKSIRFFIQSSFSSEDILKEFQELVQVKKPEFKIIAEGLWGDREL